MPDITVRINAGGREVEFRAACPAGTPIKTVLNEVLEVWRQTDIPEDAPESEPIKTYPAAGLNQAPDPSPRRPMAMGFGYMRDTKA